MKVCNLMTSEPATCSPSDHLASAAMKMWTNDCGILPVVEDSRTLGVVTDRDIAMALAMKESQATAVTVADVITGDLFSCAPEDEVADALTIMRDHRVRRLPVLDGGRLIGILSLNDIALEARASAGKERRPTYEDLAATLQAVCGHRAYPVSA